jgi:phytoene/squalene synthetase
MERFNNEVKCSIEQEIREEFAEALIGIKRLPASSRFGVYLAYRYYLSLFRKIRKTPAHEILNARIRIPNMQKISLMMSSYVQYKVANV